MKFGERNFGTKHSLGLGASRVLTSESGRKDLDRCTYIMQQRRVIFGGKQMNFTKGGEVS